MQKYKYKIIKKNTKYSNMSSSITRIETSEINKLANEYFDKVTTGAEVIDIIQRNTNCKKQYSQKQKNQIMAYCTNIK